VDTLTLFGLFAVTAMMVCYAWKVAATGSCWPPLEPVHWHRPTGSCKAHGSSALLKEFGRWWRSYVGGVDCRSLELRNGCQCFDDPAVGHRAVPAPVNELPQLGTKRLEISELSFDFS
jgi:hypothetical protein